MLKTEARGLCFQNLPLDLANVNAWKTMFDPYIVHIHLPETDNCPSRISGRQMFPSWSRLMLLFRLHAPLCILPLSNSYPILIGKYSREVDWMPFISDVSANYHIDKTSMWYTCSYTYMVHVLTYIVIHLYCNSRPWTPRAIIYWLYRVLGIYSYHK